MEKTATDLQFVSVYSTSYDPTNTYSTIQDFPFHLSVSLPSSSPQLTNPQKYLLVQVPPQFKEKRRKRKLLYADNCRVDPQRKSALLFLQIIRRGASTTTAFCGTTNTIERKRDQVLQELASGYAGEKEG